MVTCADGKILNPHTRRCVSVTGAIGKRLLGGRAAPAGPAPARPAPVAVPAKPAGPCPPGKIVNPDTGRCVKVDGAIGKRLLGGNRPNAENRRPKARMPGTLASPAFSPVAIGGANVRVPRKIDRCDHVLTYRQQGGICWFTAIMTVLFTSQRMRLRVSKAVRRLTSPAKALIAGDIARILAGYDKRQVSPHLFGRLEPHMFLQSIRGRAPNVFDNADREGGRNAEFYLHKMLDFLEIPHLSVTRASAKDRTVTYSMLNLGVSRREDHTRNVLREKTFVTVRNPDVILVLTGNPVDQYLQYYMQNRTRPDLKPLQGLVSGAHAPEITYGGVTYTLDAAKFSNFNRNTCGKSHAIAGVTCNNKRFVYNGWAAKSKDPAMPANAVGMARQHPCALMPVDWQRRRKLKIDAAGCAMVPATQNDRVKSMVFDTVQESVALYVRKADDGAAAGVATRATKPVRNVLSPPRVFAKG
jgi:hypothetical protein